MPSTDTPTWWADVQQEREDLIGRKRRSAEDWLGEDIDFVPRRRPAARTVELEVADSGIRTIELELHAEPAVPTAEPPADAPRVARGARTAERDAGALPRRTGSRRTVQVTGRPDVGRSRAASPATDEGGRASQAKRLRPRTTSDRVGHRPDRVALWAVLLGAILILLAATSSSSQAATLPSATSPAPVVTHVAAPAPSAAPTAPRL